MAALNKHQAAKAHLHKVNKTRVRVNKVNAARDKDRKDKWDHKVAGTRTPAHSKVSKAKAAWAVDNRDKVVAWEVTAIQAADPRAEAARVVAWAPAKEGMIYKLVD